MPELALLTVQRDEDDSWRWTAYGERGERLGWQERCTDLGHALEDVMVHPDSVVLVRIFHVAGAHIVSSNPQ